MVSASISLISCSSLMPVVPNCGDETLLDMLLERFGETGSDDIGRLPCDEPGGEEFPVEDPGDSIERISRRFGDIECFFADDIFGKRDIATFEI